MLPRLHLQPDTKSMLPIDDKRIIYCLHAKRENLSSKCVYDFDEEYQPSSQKQYHGEIICFSQTKISHYSVQDRIETHIKDSERKHWNMHIKQVHHQGCAQIRVPEYERHDFDTQNVLTYIMEKYEKKQ